MRHMRRQGLGGGCAGEWLAPRCCKLVWPSSHHDLCHIHKPAAFTVALSWISLSSTTCTILQLHTLET